MLKIYNSSSKYSNVDIVASMMLIYSWLKFCSMPLCTVCAVNMFASPPPYAHTYPKEHYFCLNVLRIRPLKIKVGLNFIQRLVMQPTEKRFACFRNTSQLMLYRTTVAVYCENNMG
jgi:hypothetical protein